MCKVGIYLVLQGFAVSINRMTGKKKNDYY
jgi:hypothetical protein